MATRDGDDYAALVLLSAFSVHLASHAALEAVREGGRADGRPLGALGVFFDWERQAQAVVDGVRLAPGERETTRVLLRRVPWKVLARADAGPDLDHVRLLAEQRGVPVEEVDELPYRCVGLIHPRYTRGATGADGRAVSR